jgi:predicted nucleotidyltransferase
MTVSEIHRLAGTGSENGVRRALSRLVREGTVRAEERAVATFYEGNREHLAWSAVEILAGMRRALHEKIREELSHWDPRAIHASLFGSAARGDGDADSDIDILLIRPDNVDENQETWALQIDHLRRRIEVWTGNYCQVFQIDLDRLRAHVDASDGLVDEWLRDEIILAGDPLRTILRHLPHQGAT